MPYVQSALDDEERIELDALRLRAYGPHADIDRDAAAVARLAQLEAVAHAGIDVIADASMLDAAAASDIREAVFGPDSAHADEASETPAIDLEPRSVRRGPHRWLGHVAWAAAGAAVGAVVATALSLGSVSEFDAVLQPLGDGPDTSAGETVSLSAGVEQLLSTSSSDYTRYEDYQGIAVIAESQPNGIRCLMVMTELFGGWINSCVPAGMDPVIDLSVYEGAPYELYDPDSFKDLPVGSTVRMTWVEGEVRVQIGRASDGPGRNG